MSRRLSASAGRSTSPAPRGKHRLQPAARSSAVADRKPIKLQALSSYPGARTTKRPDHKPPAGRCRSPRKLPRINNVNADLRQNQWPDLRVNTGKGSLVSKARFSKISKPDVFKTLAIEISSRMQPNTQQSRGPRRARF